MKINAKHLCCLYMYLLLCACNSYDEYDTINDSRLFVYMKALNGSNRINMGFAAIPDNTKVVVKSSTTRQSEKYMYILSDVKFVILFDTSTNNILWVGEQNIYTGPGIVKSRDGNYREMITLEYNMSSNKKDGDIMIYYTGSDPDLVFHELRKYEDIVPYLKKWGYRK